jgi:hypothetical protein
MSTIADNILRKISRKSAKDIWKSLTDKYEDRNLQNVIFLRRRFLNSKQETNESVEDFIDKVEMLREELETVHTVEVTDEDTAMTILSGLLPAYENFVQCLTINIKTAKLEDVKSSLINEEKRRQEKKIDKKTISSENEQIFYIKTKKGKGKWNKSDKQCDNCEKFGHYAKDCKAAIQCYNCDKFGHYARDCRSAKRDKQNTNNKKNYSNKANINVKEKETFAFTTNENYIKRDIKWLLDSGATNQMSWEEENFEEMKQYDSKVKVGDGRS